MHLTVESHLDRCTSCPAKFIRSNISGAAGSCSLILVLIGRCVGESFSVVNLYQPLIYNWFAQCFAIPPDTAGFLHKTVDYSVPKTERSMLWDDRVFTVGWR